MGSDNGLGRAGGKLDLPSYWTPFPPCRKEAFLAHFISILNNWGSFPTKPKYVSETIQILATISTEGEGDGGEKISDFITLYHGHGYIVDGPRLDSNVESAEIFKTLIQ